MGKVCGGDQLRRVMSSGKAKQRLPSNSCPCAGAFSVSDRWLCSWAGRCVCVCVCACACVCVSTNTAERHAKTPRMPPDPVAWHQGARGEGEARTLSVHVACWGHVVLVEHSSASITHL